MQKRFLVYLFFLLSSISSFSAQAQTDSASGMRVSVLTCAPGPELYSTFGHTAIRIVDSSTFSDLVYNYGVIGESLNYDDPRFYVRFMRGKIKYMLAAYSFREFMYEYQSEQRSVWEQELNLTNAQKKELLTKLEDNLREDKRYYKYDFWLDNCSTRPRDLLYKKLPGLHLEKNIIPPHTTPRMLIHAYLDKAGQSWSKLGIDILLGQLMDKPIDDNGAMFLPDYLMKGLDYTNNNGQPIVREKKTILNLPSPIEPSGKYVPLLAVMLFSLIYLSLYWLLRNKKNAYKILDAFLLFLTGLLGVLLVVMWTATDHTVCKNNWNILWAVPTNIIAAFINHRKTSWLSKYFLFCFLVSIVLIGGWFWLPQDFNIALLPLVILMTYRYGRRSIIQENLLANR
ncbi:MULTISPECIES: Lnb N-terminal periplasmic domain-containing protein [Chitinophagaceae]